MVWSTHSTPAHYQGPPLLGAWPGRRGLQAEESVCAHGGGRSGRAEVSPGSLTAGEGGAGPSRDGALLALWPGQLALGAPAGEAGNSGLRLSASLHSSVSWTLLPCTDTGSCGAPAFLLGVWFGCVRTEEPRDRSPLEPCVPGLRVSQQHSTGCGMSRFLAEEMGASCTSPGRPSAILRWLPADLPPRDSLSPTLCPFPGMHLGPAGNLC